MNEAPIKRQRVLVRRCNAKLRIPTMSGTDPSIQDVLFQCSKDAGHEEEEHEESGTVQYDNQTQRDYTITWLDRGIRTLRTRSSRNTSS